MFSSRVAPLAYDAPGAPSQPAKDFLDRVAFLVPEARKWGRRIDCRIRKSQHLVREVQPPAGLEYLTGFVFPSIFSMINSRS